MQTHRLILVASLVILHPIAAYAQAAPRDPDAAARAAREANNPLRVIIEASKLRSRATEVAPVRPVVAKPAVPAPVPVAAKAQAAPAAVVAASQPVAAPAPPIVPAVARAEPAPTPAPAPAPVTLSMPAPVVPAPKPAPPLPLKLAQMVEPALPPAVLRRMLTDMEVVVGFTVNADGSVSNVAVRSSPMKSLDAPVIDAISQWRYEPTGEPRVHAVQLVLRAVR